MSVAWKGQREREREGERERERERESGKSVLSECLDSDKGERVMSRFSDQIIFDLGCI